MNDYDEWLQELQTKIAAKNRLETVLKELRRQQAELSDKIEELESRKLAEDADVDVSADMQVNIEGFLRFADYFFDGMFADWTVLDRISQSQGQVQKVKSQIGSVLDKLNAMKTSVKAEQNGTETKLRELVKSIAI